MYDIIGDLHGHADRLVELLTLLGYERSGGTFAHRERKVIFLGDFIDRGPQIREVLEIVRPMIEEGKALAVMGNHELNALAYHTRVEGSTTEFLRRHSDRNTHQHCKTLDQVPLGELASYLEWFRSLPMWLDLGGLRVVHACWDTRHIHAIQAALERHRGVTDAFLQLACTHGNPLFKSVEIVLKGKEMKLPDGVTFADRYGYHRTHCRTRWYLHATGQTVQTYAFESNLTACNVGVEAGAIAAAEPYPPTAPPVFVGHYWLFAETPAILADNVACVDYSVAKGGFLCAYRWNGEGRLKNEHFARVAAKQEK